MRRVRRRRSRSGTARRVTQAYLVDAQPGAPVQLIGPAGAVSGYRPCRSAGSFLIRDLTPGPDTGSVSGRAGNTFAVRAAAAGPRHSTGVSGSGPATTTCGCATESNWRSWCGCLWARRWPTARSPQGHRVFGISGRGAGDRGGRDRQTVEETGSAGHRCLILGGAIGPAAGFATVIVQMRGGGCSGGAFDLFDYIRRSTTATTVKPWPPSRGWPATGSGWWHLVLGICSSRWRGPVRRACGDRRCRSPTTCIRPVFPVGSFNTGFKSVDHRTAEGRPGRRPLVAAIRQGTGATRRRGAWPISGCVCKPRTCAG